MTNRDLFKAADHNIDVAKGTILGMTIDPDDDDFRPDVIDVVIDDLQKAITDLKQIKANFLADAWAKQALFQD